MSDVGSTAGGTPLSIRQERVWRLLQEVEQKLAELAQGLEKTEPKKAQRLRQALTLLQQERTDERLYRIVALLREEKLDAADQAQQDTMALLRRVMEELLREEDDAAALAQERQTWENLRQAVAALIARQRELQADGARLGSPGDKEQALAELAQRLAALEAALKAQATIHEQTRRATQDQPAALPAQAAEQENQAQQTEALARDGERPDTKNPAGSPAQEAAAQALKDAAAQQHQAGQQLAQGRGQAAQGSQQEALAQLQKALQALQQERQRLAALAPDPAQSLAPPQEQLAQQTQGTAQSLEQAGQNASGAGAASGGPAAGQRAQAARAALEQARQAMRQAAQRLRQSARQQAQAPQEEALRQLRQAQAQIEEQLRQMRREMRMEQLAGLAARLSQMLERQKPVTAATEALGNKPPAQWLRADDLACLALGEEEQAIAQQAALCLEVLQQDGTTVVFPRLVEQLQRDLTDLAAWLRGRRTDALTQRRQHEVEDTLTQLLAAVEDARQWQKDQEQAKPSDNPPQNPQANDRLAPPSAELKLLKAAQERVHQGTMELDQARATLPAAQVQSETQRLEAQQQQVRQMAQWMIER